MFLLRFYSDEFILFNINVNWEFLSLVDKFNFYIFSFFGFSYKDNLFLVILDNKG